MEDIGESLTRMIKDRNLTDKYEELIQEVLDDPDVTQFIADNRQKLDDEAIVKSYAKLYEYVQEKRNFN